MTRIEIEAPPELPDDDATPGPALTVLPMLGGLGSLLLLTTSAGGSPARAAVAAGIMLTATLAVAGAQLDRQRRRSRRRLARSRARYRRHLAEVRARARQCAADQRAEALDRFRPPHLLPQRLAHLPHPPRAAAPSDPIAVRIGVAAAPLAATWQLAPDPGERTDPVCAEARRRLVTAHAEVDDVPLVLDLREHRVLLPHGTEDDVRAWARALICSAAAAHPAATLAVEVRAAADRLPEWDWLKWVPHTGAADAAHRLVVLDGTDPTEQDNDATTVVVLTPSTEPPAVGTPVTLTPAHDRCGPATAEAIARRLAGRGSADHAVAGWRTLLDAAGSPAGARLQVPLGLDPDGVPVTLDLREAAEGGVGPHGLVVGATGSGKSELLRTLVVGLAARHPPSELTFVLIDFKGGATFAEVAALPHVAGAITNLADDLELVERAEDVLAGELVRRQELLRAAGAASVREARARGAGAASDLPDLPDLPDLLVVVDEFSELLLARPSCADLFAAIGRLGRSLGLHLVLATQRLEEGRLRGLEAHLSYRIALRTFSAAESRAAIGVPDAVDLPQAPGHALLRCGPGGPVAFRAVHLGDPAPPPHRGGGSGPPRLRAFRNGPATIHPPSPRPGPTLLEAQVAALRTAGAPTRRLWLPPLSTPPRLGELVGGVTTGSAGLHSPRLRADGGLRVPIGLVDRPREQRHDPFVVDLSGAGGHVAVVGGARSGVSTTLRTLVAALGLAASPRELQVLAISPDDPATWRLPHLAGIAGPHDPAAVRRLVEAAGDLLADRARAQRERGACAEGRVVLVVDDWSALRLEDPDLEGPLLDLAARGLGLGVHLLLGARRWSDLRPALRDLLGTRVELRLGDPDASAVDRRRAAAVPVDRPGRGLTPSGHHLLIARPELADGVPVARALTEAWPGPPPPQVRTLPDRIDLDAVRPAVPSGAVALGWEERSWGPATWHPDADPHLLVLGDAGSGRTATLRAVAAELARLHAPDSARLIVVDPRRSLLEAVPEGHVLHHAGEEEAIGRIVTDLAAYLRARLPGPGLTAAQLRARSWWTGAEVFVLVDDADLLGVGGPSPLRPLAPLLPHARDIGLHLVLARRMAGVSRAWGDPVLTALRDLGGPALLLAGSPDEGPVLGGLRPTPAVPGRARLLRRGDDVRRVQVAWTPGPGDP